MFPERILGGEKSMSYFQRVLQTKQAKEAIGQGVISLAETGSFEAGVDAMITKGNQNGSAFAALIAIILDVFGIPDKS